MKWITRIGLVLLALAAAAGGWWYLQNRAASSATGSGTYTQIVDVQQGGLSSALTVVGQLDALQSATLTFERMKGTTRLLTLAAGPGQSVEAGDLIATIDPAPYQQALDQARSDLEAAEEHLAELQTPATALAVAKAGQAVAQAEHDLRQAQADLATLQAPDLTNLQAALRTAQENLTLARLQQTLAEHDSLARSERDLGYAVNWHLRRIADLETLVAQGRANAEQIEALADQKSALGDVQADLARVQAQRELSLATAAANVAKAQAAVADAQEALAAAEAGGDPLSTAKAQLAVRTAEVALLSAREARAELDEGADAAALATAQADVDRKRLALADAEAALAGTQLTAPFAGTILQTYAAAGDTVAANTRIVALANLDALQVLASVDETTIRRVAAGQAATITFDALTGRSFTGQVASVPLQGSLQGGVMIYEVPITLAGSEQLDLLIGMTANVQIQTGRVENALLVPTMALQRVSGLYQVRIPNAADPNGEPETVPVEIGLSDGTYTQILRGLVPGDQVVVEYSTGTSTGFGLRGMGIMGGITGAPAGVQRPSGR